MRKFLLLLLIAAFAEMSFAQNADKKWSFGAFYGKTEYNGDLGNGFIFKKGQSFYQFGAISISRYLNPSFNVGIFSSYGDYGYYKTATRRFLGSKFDVAPLLYYKLDNGYIFKEGAIIAPYITAGVGYARVWGSSSRLMYKGNDVILPVGGGVKINFTKWMALQYQLLYVFTNHDYHDRVANGHKEQFASHSLGLAFSFGKKKAAAVELPPVVEEVVPVPEPTPVPAPAPPPAPKPEPPVQEMPKIQYSDTVLVHFAFDKSYIESKDVPKLEKLANEMIQNPELSAHITGYTDNVGPERVNMPLSKVRAEAVKKFLVKKGVDASRITTDGKGASNFVAPNTTPQGRQLNRRAVTIVTN